jgi:hypothetical protein
MQAKLQDYTSSVSSWSGKPVPSKFGAEVFISANYSVKRKLNFLKINIYEVHLFCTIGS